MVSAMTMLLACSRERSGLNVLDAGTQQRNADVLDLSKLKFHHRLKIQEQSFSFNLAESQLKKAREQ